MSDDHGKLPDQLGNLDWDSALDEWEKSTFVSTEGASPAPTASGESTHRVPSGSLQNYSGEGTVIARVPLELREQASRRVSEQARARTDAPLSPPSPSVEPPTSAATLGSIPSPSASGGELVTATRANEKCEFRHHTTQHTRLNPCAPPRAHTRSLCSLLHVDRRRRRRRRRRL